MPRGRVHAARPATTRPVRAKGGRRRHFDTSAAPEASVGGIVPAKGFHPYYCAINEAWQYVVVKTFHGQHPEEVSAHKTPREAIDACVALNAGL